MKSIHLENLVHTHTHTLTHSPDTPLKPRRKKLSLQTHAKSSFWLETPCGIAYINQVILFAQWMVYIKAANCADKSGPS